MDSLPRDRAKIEAVIRSALAVRAASLVERKQAGGRDTESLAESLPYRDIIPFLIGCLGELRDGSSGRGNAAGLFPMSQVEIDHLLFPAGVGMRQRDELVVNVSQLVKTLETAMELEDYENAMLRQQQRQSQASSRSRTSQQQQPPPLPPPPTYAASLRVASASSPQSNVNLRRSASLFALQAINEDGGGSSSQDAHPPAPVAALPDRPPSVPNRTSSLRTSSPEPRPSVLGLHHARAASTSTARSPTPGSPPAHSLPHIRGTSSPHSPPARHTVAMDPTRPHSPVLIISSRCVTPGLPEVRGSPSLGVPIQAVPPASMPAARRADSQFPFYVELRGERGATAPAVPHSVSPPPQLPARTAAVAPKDPSALPRSDSTLVGIPDSAKPGAPKSTAEKPRKLRRKPLTGGPHGGGARILRTRRASSSSTASSADADCSTTLQPPPAGAQWALPGRPARPALGMVFFVTASFAVLMLCIVLEGGMEPLTQNPWLGPNQTALVHWGARYVDCMRPSARVPPDRVLAVCGMGGMHAQWWRWITASFVPRGFIQFLFTTALSLRLGSPLEKSFGLRRTLAIYLVTGAAGFLASGLLRPGQLETGANGSAYGLLGALFVDHLVHWPVLVHPFLDLLKWVLGTALALAIGWVLPFVDNIVHVAGWAAGILVAVAIRPRVVLVLPTPRFDGDADADGPVLVVLPSATALSQRRRIAGLLVRVVALVAVVAAGYIGASLFYRSTGPVDCYACRYLNWSTLP
ncbi:hypothetical protein H9P43_000325 [Blastocladiella emersonii ATCC 22665]|nr:hypothetical protein H9P43_000325 [Blastocladiella emersonii ATCC 22665]